MLRGLLSLPAMDNAPGCLGQALVVSHRGTAGSLGSVYLCARWGPGRGWGPSPFSLPAWLGAGNSPGLSQLVPFLPLQLALGVGWGGVGRRLFALAPEAGCAPAAFSRHALALPGTPGLRSGTALSGCQASFPISEGELPTLRRLLGPVPRKPGLWAAHPPMPRGDSDPGRCLESPPGHRILELTTRRNVPTSQPPPAPEGTHPPAYRAPGKCQCEVQVSFPVVHTATYLPWVGSFPPTHC